MPEAIERIQTVCQLEITHSGITLTNKSLSVKFHVTHRYKREFSRFVRTAPLHASVLPQGAPLGYCPRTSSSAGRPSTPEYTQYNVIEYMHNRPLTTNWLVQLYEK